MIAGGPYTYRWAHRWPAFATRQLLRTWGIRVKQHNTELLHNLPQCVIVINHRSDLDALIATGYMPGIYKFIGKKELARYPFIGMLVRSLHITVDRASATSKKRSLEELQTQSATGANIVVFPEGWANFSHSYLLELRRGAFKTAIEMQLPLLVCTMVNTHEIFPKPAIKIIPGTAHVYWEKLIPTNGLNFEKDGARLLQEVEQIFLSRLKEHYPNGYTYPLGQKDFETWKQQQLKR